VINKNVCKQRNVPVRVFKAIKITEVGVETFSLILNKEGFFAKLKNILLKK
jgi:hypothetical protein